MPTCSFCKKNYSFPRGITIFQSDGSSLHFCSSKCRSNHKLGRDSRKVNWVKRDKKGKVVEKVNLEEIKEAEKSSKEVEKEK